MSLSGEKKWESYFKKKEQCSELRIDETHGVFSEVEGFCCMKGHRIDVRERHLGGQVGTCMAGSGAWL